MHRLMRLNNDTKISLFTAVLLLFIVSASIAGITYAWFFEDEENLTPAQFTAGTVKVDLDGTDPGENPEITAENGCKLYTWRLKSMGTKSSYVRIRVDGDEVEGIGDTAWAYLAGKATPLNEVFNANRWGWTNRIENEGLTELYLYAGAGGNDLDKGTHVGKVEVNFSPADEVYGPEKNTVDVEYTIFNGSNYVINEAHLWIGEDRLPEHQSSGKKTAAPGQFPYRYNNGHITIVNGKSASFTLVDEDLAPPFYVAAHAKDAGLTDSIQPVQIGQICEGNWFLYDGYYYYGDPTIEKVQKMPAGEVVTFCLSVCLPDKIDYEFKIQIESVQSTNNAIEAIGWPQAVWEQNKFL